MECIQTMFYPLVMVQAISYILKKKFLNDKILSKWTNNSYNKICIYFLAFSYTKKKQEKLFPVIYGTCFFCFVCGHFTFTWYFPSHHPTWTKFKVSVLQYSYKSVSEQFIICVDRKKMHYPHSNFEEKQKFLIWKMHNYLQCY